MLSTREVGETDGMFLESFASHIRTSTKFTARQVTKVIAQELVFFSEERNEALKKHAVDG